MWVATLGQTYLQGRAADRIILIDLWVQALTEAADDSRSAAVCVSRCARCTTSSRT